MSKIPVLIKKKPVVTTITGPHLEYTKLLPKIKSRTIKVGTDCSGIEAPIQALELLQVPYDHLFSSEINPRVRKIAERNYAPKKYYTDITKRNHEELPKLDLYIAGFPCQPFSTLGKHQGFDDQKGRGTIFFECYNTIIATDPEMFILENVKGLVSHNNGNTFKTIMLYLSQLNYDIYRSILNTKDFGLPQNRERIYIVGLKKGKFQPFSFPQPIPLNVHVTDILEEAPTSSLTDHKKTILHDLVKYGTIDKLSDPWVVNLNSSSYKRSSPMLNISPCLLASGSIYYVTSEKRNLTPTEFLKLQGFHRFDLCGEYSKIYGIAGNSMSVPVIAFIISNMLMSMF